MSKEFRYIVRILGTDVDGALKVPYGLARIKGVGLRFGLAVSRAAGIDPETRTGSLSDSQVQRLEDVIKKPTEHGIPTWMLNRRNDMVLGSSFHLHGADLSLYVKEDIQREVRTKSWRGIRHSLGLKVRGQRTRTTGRKGPAVGVARKRLEELRAAAAEEEKK